MTFGDIFNAKFLEYFDPEISDFNIYTILFVFGAALLIGIFIYFVYKHTFGGVMYSRSFNVSLVGLVFVSTFVILAVTSNVILSLGMIGALSIVRFRTAIKDPMDLVFLFWAIAAGIVTGAQIYILSIIGSLVIGIILVLASKRFILDSPYLVIINCDNQMSEGTCVSIIKNYSKKARLKSKIVSAGKGTELIYEIRSKGESTEFINELSALEGVHNASIVSYNGEFLD